MRILYYPQLSTRAGPEFDSNFHLIINWFYGDGEDLILLWPKQYESAKELIKKYVPRAEIVDVNYDTLYFSERFYIDLNTIEKTIVFEEPDVIFIHEPTHVMTIKSLLLKMNKNIPIATMNSWPDYFDKAPQGLAYIFRQVEGYYGADKIFYWTRAHLMMILNQMDFIQGKFWDSIYNKFRRIPAPVREDLFNTVKTGNEYIVAYGDRRSPYHEYAEAEDRFNKFVEKYHIPYTRFYSLGYEDYFDIITKPDRIYILVQTFTKVRMWSIVAADFIASGNYVVLPNHSCFVEMVPEDLRYSDEEELKQIIDAIKEGKVKDIMKAVRHYFMMEHSSSKARRVLYSELEELLRR